MVNLQPTELVVCIGEHTYKLYRRTRAATHGVDEWELIRTETHMGWHTLHIERYTVDGVWVHNVLPNRAIPAPHAVLTQSQGTNVLNSLNAKERDRRLLAAQSLGGW